ncbi:unnamed protein product [Parascedosporium putredinis]|uniref:Apple domain-containing protein n=1 Tax=Parascedosporium putredinis TaxID=1442378 RepID=A0A9P1HBB7_9PEZI|nr:unnamed protein product [Parascedosporium putredinis]CAI8003803.1 unnamed protein product [Parascedosporium putredinis]
MITWDKRREYARIGAGIAFSKKRKPNSTPILSTSTSDITCPDSNNSTFQSPTNSDIYFRLSCGLDHPTSLGSIDLSSSSTASMGACIDLCAEKDECLGASWEARRFGRGWRRGRQMHLEGSHWGERKRRRRHLRA